MWQKTARFKGPYKPIGEVQICRILSNWTIIGLILHRNRKRLFYEVFQKADENREKIGARIGLIFPLIRIPDFLVHYERSSPFAVLSGTRHADKCTLPHTCPVVL
jgi:hypothetical protein